MSHPPGGSGNSPQQRSTLAWLLAILALGTLVRLWVWHGHAVDPDEGAHLMDARLALQGFVPYVDYQARGIMYMYVLAGFMRLVGTDYSAVRLCLVLIEPLTALLLFLIARRLASERVGLIAAATYLLFPLAVRSAPIIHMEPLAVLCACGVVYQLVRHLQPGGGWGALLVAGLVLGLAINVRESGIVVALSSVLTLAIVTWHAPRLLLRRCAVLLGGFVAFCVAMNLLYVGRLDLGRWWLSPLNPLYVLVRHARAASLQTIARTADTAGAAVVETGAEPLRAHSQSWFTSWHSLEGSFLALLPLFLALLLSAGCLAIRRQRVRDARARFAAAVLYPWALAFTVAYGYWAVYRDFYPEYVVEIVPPLAIIFGVVLTELLEQWGHGQAFGWALVLATASALFVYLGFPPGPSPVPRYLYLAVPAVALAPPWLGWRHGARWWAVVAILGLAIQVVPLPLPFAAKSALKLAALAALVGGAWLVARTLPGPVPGARRLALYSVLLVFGAALGVALDFSSHEVSLRFGSVWSRDSVRQIVGELRRRGRPHDEVLSGGVIWEYQSNLQPFGRISHPLKYEFGILPGDAAWLADLFGRRPPRFVVYDGYTERTYGRVLPTLDRTVRERYDLIATAPSGAYQVRLFERRGAAP